MRKSIAVAALFALAACTPPAEAPSAPEAPAAPQSLIEQVQSRSAEMQPVFAWETLRAYQTAHPESQPPCASIRRAESGRTVPANVDPASIYGPYSGALVFSIQCGPQLTTVRSEPREHWLVVMAPGATEPVVVNCAAADGRDQCNAATIPTVAPAPAAAP